MKTLAPSSGVSATDFDVRTIANPSQAQLRRLALEHTPACFETAHGNLVKHSRNKARKAACTYVVADAESAPRFAAKTIEPAKAAELVERQRAYIEEQGTLIELDAYLGLGEHAFGVQWLYTLEGANIAGMQQILSFPRDQVEDDPDGPFAPLFRVIYTPNLMLDDMPGGQAIIVDLENWTTYVMGPDYFGESKKGALRMLNEHVYREGGLVLHAGAKAVTVDGKSQTMTIMGLSGTGKTTTTFSKQGEITQPIQDDMVCIWPGGACSVTENGCFAKTHGLTLESEPVIYEGTLSPIAWVENVYTTADGTFEFSKGILSPEDVKRLADVLVLTGADAENVARYISGEASYADIVDENGIPNDGWDFVQWTQNGRSIIPMSAVQDAADLHRIPTVHSMGILNRDEGTDACMPGVVRFTSPEQAAGYFMLGETTKTSAAGKDRGKTRSPFTQPFFPSKMGLQAERFSELVATMPETDTWLMNTGFVGGDAQDVELGNALKVKIRHSSAMLEAMLSGDVAWKRDPDFGYEIVDIDHPASSELLEKVPAEILNPVRFYQANDRMEIYRKWVGNMKRERESFLRSHGVADSIIEATV